MTSYRYDPNKPITAANYPLVGNPYHHYYSTRNKPILMGVIHITAGLSDFIAPDYSAESTLKYSSTTSVQASYTGIVDSDTIQDCLPDNYTAWAQGVSGHNFNSPALSLEIGKREVDWRQPPTPAAWADATIRNAAIWWAPRVKRYGIPVRFVNDRNQIDQLIAAGKMVGFTEHHVLDPTNRSDAGFISAAVTTFPWAMFLKYVNEEVAKLGGTPPPPPKPPDVTTVNRALTKAIQTWVEAVPADGLWGAGTDYRTQNMRTACKMFCGYPTNSTGLWYDVRLVQQIIDTPVDGVFGNASKAALKVWLVQFQRVIGTAGDGAWGPACEALYQKIRTANLNKF